MRNLKKTHLAAAVAGLALASTFVGVSCGGDDTTASGGASTQGGAGGPSSGTHHPTGSNTGTGGGTAGSGGAPGTGGTSNAGGSGGMIDPGQLDCTAPSGTLGGLKLTPFVDGLDNSVDLKPVPGDPTRLIVVEQSGKLRLIKNGSLVDEAFLDLTDTVDFDGAEQGLLSVVFHPDYKTNGRFFVYYSASGAGLMTVAEFAISSNDPDKANPTAVQVIITQDTLDSNHNGGTLAFGPLDKKLYITWGDGGGGNDDDQDHLHGMCGNGQNKQKLLGKILRLDIDSKADGKNYTPAGSGISGALPEIWDYGLRNPWRVSFDGCTGDLFIGDVGQDTHEELDHEPAGMGGKNYGWRCYEGDEACPSCNNTGCPCDATGFTAPLVSLSRNIAQTVIGGYVYRGSTIPALRGMYLFADAAAAKVWVLDPATSYAFQADGNGNNNFGHGTLGSPVSFGQDLKGEVYVVDHGGSIYRVDAN